MHTLWGSNTGRGSPAPLVGLWCVPLEEPPSRLPVCRAACIFVLCERGAGIPLTSHIQKQRIGTALLDFTWAICWFWGKHPVAVSWDYVTFLLLRGHLARYILLFKSKNRMGTLCFVTSVSFFHSLSCTLRATSCSLLCKQPHIIWPYWQFVLSIKLRPCLWGCVLSVSQLDNLKDKDYCVKHCAISSMNRVCSVCAVSWQWHCALTPKQVLKYSVQGIL